MVKITFLGSCREVGRSAILIESRSGDKCMLDYGIRFRGKPRVPQEADLKQLKGVALTHCHIDHSGALPLLYKDGKALPFFTNQVSLRIIETLIKDMIRISRNNLSFGLIELNRLISNAYFLKNEYRQKIADDFYITFYNAGHVPGSVSILVEVDDKKILYTGDINSQDTNLTSAANPEQIKGIDALISETTYALRNHPIREDIEKNFMEKIISTTESGGKVLVPAFGVARSQEALLILSKYGYEGKLFLDGLAKEVSRIYLQYPESLMDGKAFKKSLKRAKFISPKERNKVKQSNGVIIAPSGMLKGGAAISFMKSFLNDPSSAILLIGYQVEGTPGRKLLEEKVFEYHDRFIRDKSMRDIKIEAKCSCEYYDFSSHSDGHHLHQYIEKLEFLNGSKQVFCVHGDTKSATTFSSELTKKGYDSVAPEIGESYRV